MFNEPKYWQKPDKTPSCEHFCGDDRWCSDVCVCFMDDGTFDLLRYLGGENQMKWNNQDNKKVVAWMEL